MLTDKRLRLTHWFPFVIPPLYLAFILSLQPADHFGSVPDKAPWLNRAVYDDWDLTAMALRGLNASTGRIAGRADNPEQVPDEQYARLLQEPGIRLLGVELSHELAASRDDVPSTERLTGMGSTRHLS